MKILKLFLLTMLVLACGVAAVVVCANLPAPAADAAAESEAAAFVSDEVAPISFSTTAPTVSTEGEALLDLNNYVIVYRSGLKAEKALCEQMADRLSVLSGTSVSVTTGSNGSRLLVVATTASTDGLAQRAASLCNVSASGNEFGIAVVGRHIVIIGSNTVYATLGAQYFMDTYLGEGASTELVMPRVIKANISTATSAASLSKIVYSRNLEHDDYYDFAQSDPVKGYGSAAPGFTGNSGIVDQAYLICEALHGTKMGMRHDEFELNDSGHISSITQQIGTRAHDCPYCYCDETAAAAGEILIGDTNRPESATALKMINKNQCIVAMIDGKLVATGHTFEAKLCAAEAVKTLFANGATDITLPSDLCLILTVNHNAVSETDVMLPSLTLDRVMDINDNDLMYLYTTGVSENAYTTYCDALLAAGYEIVTESSLAGSHFKTFVYPAGGKMLQVDYNAFAKTGEALGSSSHTASGGVTEAVFGYATPTIRIVVSDWLSNDLPDAELLNPNQTYTKLTDSTVTAIDLGEAGYGTGYIMMLEDGRFVVVDGGGAATDLDNVWSIFVDLYKKAHNNAEPTKENPVVIAAWLVSHSHGDHTGMMTQFSHRFSGTYSCSSKDCAYCFDGEGNRKEGDHGLATMQYMFVTYPSRTEYDNVAEAGAASYNTYFREAKWVKPVTGQTLYIANMKIETLFTHKDVFPQHTTAMNDTSTIQRLNFVMTTSSQVDQESGKTALDHGELGTLKSYSFIATGDLFIQGSRWLCAMYGKELKADMVAMAHHGGPGAEAAFYDNVAPTVVWWPQSKDSVHPKSGKIPDSGFIPDYYKYTSGYLGGSAWYDAVDQYVTFGLSSVKYIYLSDDYNVTITLNGAFGQNAYYVGKVATDAGNFTYVQVPSSKPSSDQSTHNTFSENKPVLMYK